MSKIDFIHLLPGHFPYGAHGMLTELHYALSKYHLEDVNQTVICAKGSGAPSWFGVPTSHVRYESLVKWCRKHKNNPVIFMHKLASTQCPRVSCLLYGKVPFVIINHTQSTKFQGLARANAVVAVSEHMKKSMRNRTHRSKVFLIRNGVNACRFENIESNKQCSQDGYFITGRMNNFNECKHPTDWVHWLRATSFDKNLWHDYLGDGAKFKQAKLQAKNHRVKSKNVINLMGRINDYQLKIGILKSWDIFLYEIRGNEGTSMSLLEALACGVPAIINNKPGNNEVVQKGINGYVCKERPHFTKRINQLINDRERLLELKKTTREHFDKNLDAKHMAARYVELAKEVSKNA